jgi:hypothetical protein
MIEHTKKENPGKEVVRVENPDNSVSILVQ